MTRPAAPPTLVPASVLRLSREGGVAHFPGLARPRRIHCARYSEAQRGELQRLLATAARACPVEAGADRRLLHLSLEDDRGAEVWTLTIAEEAVPPALLDWWRHAESEG
ncbi:protealysin inhibitor emfourin [Halomonas ramblicola]|uniref:protealysin inhibitor emfourin n=1 Tax=Halomonas ramblicola TaxID=747349 RepID=UPI0025B3FCDB|nr:protealysin inhibitor emfourin [Halomonas ramblicola]MDN3520275.1 hypothetical protein [Halomonas ramblicola]